MVLRIDATASRELQAILLAVKRAPAEIQKQIRQQTKSIGLVQWSQALREQASTRLEHRALVDTARVTPSNQNIQLSSATVGRSLSGGLNPKTNYAAIEFGGNRNQKVSYEAVSSKGKRYRVTRRTKSQLRPRNPEGYVFFPAAVRMVPRIAALWAQTVVRTFADALEGK